MNFLNATMYRLATNDENWYKTNHYIYRLSMWTMQTKPNFCSGYSANNIEKINIKGTGNPAII